MLIDSFSNNRYSNIKDYKSAFYWLKEAYEDDEKLITYELGLCYFYGYGTQIDYYKAFDIYKKTGYIIMLIDCYYYGLGTDVDYNKCYEQIMKYISSPFFVKPLDSKMLNKLGSFFIRKRKEIEAIEMFEIAMELGDPIAQYNRALIYLNDNEGVKNESRAVELLEQSANKGYVNAMYKLGIYYISKKQVLKNLRIWESLQYFLLY